MAHDTMTQAKAGGITRFFAACLMGGLLVLAAQAKPLAPAYVQIPEGQFTSLLPPDGKQAKAQVAQFSMRVLPVTQGEFAAFVHQHPAWQRSIKMGSALADSRYLAQWPNEVGWNKGSPQAAQPITQVSWFASSAFCQSEGARLPTWHEWEYVAAASARERDARANPQWRERILAWYGQTSKTLDSVGLSSKNAYGVHDLHGLIWEWVDDFGAMMVSGDNRTQGDPDILQFCGAGALSANDRENYPVLMRMAMLSAMQAASTNRNLGFRCVRDAPAERPTKTPRRKK